MSYKNKVSKACKQDEDLLGEKFKYDKEDDIVLLFPEEKTDIAYCYKRSELARLIRRGYKKDFNFFTYIVVPHTNQYIVNPEEIISTTWHSFIVKRIPDRINYREDYPADLYLVVRGSDIDFENAPELGDEIKEENIQIVPSESYLETERKMREIRERRAEIPQEREPADIYLGRGEDYLELFNEYKGIYIRYSEIFPRQRQMYLNSDFLERTMYLDENDQKITPKNRYEPTRGVWILEEKLDNVQTTTWYNGDDISRQRGPAIIKIWKNSQGQKTRVLLQWMRNGQLFNIEMPSIFDTDGKIEWAPYMNRQEIPSDIDFNEKVMNFKENGQKTVTVKFEEENFEDTETQGKISYYDEDGQIREIIYIPA
jgi:hypothetical protein